MTAGQTTATRSVPGSDRIPHDARLLERVLACYKPHCRYLLDLETEVRPEGVTAHTRFRVPEPCYIDDTGHLNAVDVTICYNQMLYQLLATITAHRLLPEFGGWTLEDFWRKQLPDVLITRFSTAFPAPIDPQSFHGHMHIDRSGASRATSRPMLWLDTTFGYRGAQGECTGSATIAIVGP